MNTTFDATNLAASLSDSTSTPAQDEPMNTTLSMPKHITSLASAGVIISVTQSVTTFNKAAPEVGEKASRDVGAQTNLYKSSKELFLGNPTLRALLNHRQTVYNWLKLRLYPWADKQFYCPVPMLAAIQAEFNAHAAERERLKDAWGNAYESAIADAIMRSNSTFKRGDYPTKEAMLSKFTLALTISEVPVGDFRNAVAADIAQDLFNDLSRQHEARMNAMVNKQCQQLLSVMESISHCCELVHTTDKDGKTKTRRRKLYDNTIDRALEYIALFEGFNVSGNPHLSAARAALAKAFDGVTADTLRESDTMRTVIKEQVDDILKTFKPTVALDDFDDEE